MGTTTAILELVMMGLQEDRAVGDLHDGHYFCHR